MQRDGKNGEKRKRKEENTCSRAKRKSFVCASDFARYAAASLFASCSCFFSNSSNSFILAPLLSGCNIIKRHRKGRMGEGGRWDWNNKYPFRQQFPHRLPSEHSLTLLLYLPTLLSAKEREKERNEEEKVVNPLICFPSSSLPFSHLHSSPL